MKKQNNPKDEPDNDLVAKKPGKLALDEVHEESEKMTQRKAESSKLPWKKLGDKTQIVILSPWRDSGVPWYTCASHFLPKGDNKKGIWACPESVPNRYRPKSWTGEGLDQYCPICEMKRHNFSANWEEGKTVAPLWNKHYVNCFFEQKTTVSILPLPTSVKDSLVVLIEEGLDFCEQQTVFKIIRKGEGLETEYHLMQIAPWPDWKPESTTPYDLDKVFGYVFTEDYILRLKDVATSLAKHHNLELPWDKEVSEEEEEKPKKPVLKKEPACYTKYGKPDKGLTCTKCAMEIPCKTKTKKA